MKKYYFVSDAHFGAQDHATEEYKAAQFFSLLEKFEKEDADLIIVGDLFDFWFEYKYAVPIRHFKIISYLAHLVSKGKTIHYMAGNHDFWLGSFMEREVGLILHKDDFIIDNNGKKIYIYHGDGLLKKDHGYRLLKKVLRSKINIFLFRLLHPDLGVPLALFFSNWSREASKDRSNYSDVDYREFAYAKIARGYDFVVMGHTHWPALEKHNDGWYINSGNWMNDFTFAVIDGDSPSLFKWEGDHVVNIELTLPPGNKNQAAN